jgi:hypothetical protein
VSFFEYSIFSTVGAGSNICILLNLVSTKLPATSFQRPKPTEQTYLIDSDLRSLTGFMEGETMAVEGLDNMWANPIMDIRTLESKRKIAIYRRSCCKHPVSVVLLNFSFILSNRYSEIHEKANQAHEMLRAYNARRLIKGGGNPVTVKMKQAVEEHSAQTPQGMNEAEFGNWLWTLSKP